MVMVYMFPSTNSQIKIDTAAGNIVRRSSLLWAVIVHNPPRHSGRYINLSLGRLPGENDEEEPERSPIMDLDLEILCWVENKETADFIVENLRNNNGVMGIPAQGTRRMFGIREMSYPQTLSIQSSYETCERLSVEWASRASMIKDIIDQDG